MGFDRLKRKDIGIDAVEVHGCDPSLDSRLAHFYSSKAIEFDTSIFTLQRGPEFTKLCKMRATRGLVVYAQNASSIRGVAAVSVRPGYYRDQRCDIAFIGDLRIDFERDLLRNWRQIYGDLLEELATWPPPEGVCACLTTVTLPNERASRTLLQPHRLAPYRYQSLAALKMVNVLGKAPLGAWAKTLFPGGFRLLEAKPSDIDRITAFLIGQNRKRPFGFDFESELPRRLKEWPDLTIEKFWIIEDRQGKVRATAAPWSPGSAKRLICEQLPKSMVRADRWLSKLPKSRFYRMPRLPREGHPMEFLYLTHLEVDIEAPRLEREAWLAAILRNTIDRHSAEDWNFVSFADFNGDSLQGCLAGLYFHAVPMELFSVHRWDGSTIQKRLEPGPYPPAFELSLS